MFAYDAALLARVRLGNDCCTLVVMTLTYQRLYGDARAAVDGINNNGAYRQRSIAAWRMGDFLMTPA